MSSILPLIPLSFVMGFVNAIAGGGGVLGVPTLLALGLPPVNALALNRVSDMGTIIGAAHNYMRVPEFRWKLAALAVPPIIVGAFIAANLVVTIPAPLLSRIILGAVFVGIFFLLYPFKPKAEGTKPHYAAGILALFALGLWDGAFAMGGGTFGVLIFVLLFHRTFLSAKSILTFATIPETFLSGSIILWHAHVAWPHAAAMFASAVAGSYIGSHLAIQKGSRFIRYAMAGMAAVMVLKVLIFDILKT